MSGYCPDCGNTLCICDELFDELNMDGAVCMTKDCLEDIAKSTKARDNIIEDLFKMIKSGQQDWTGLFALKKEWEELKNEENNNTEK